MDIYWYNKLFKIAYQAQHETIIIPRCTFQPCTELILRYPKYSSVTRNPTSDVTHYKSTFTPLSSPAISVTSFPLSYSLFLPSLLLREVMPSNCASIAHSNTFPINVTSLLYEQYQNAPEDEWDRLYKCWGISDCGDCHRSNEFCGWCPIVSNPLHLLAFYPCI